MTACDFSASLFDRDGYRHAISFQSSKTGLQPNRHPVFDKPAVTQMRKPS
jgi:hypothetical protein